MTKINLIFSFLVLFLAACTPTTAAPDNATEPADELTTLSPMETAVSATKPPESEVTSQVIAPGEEDLQQVTAVPLKPDVPPVEAPPPVLPDPVTTLTQIARQDLASRLGVEVSEVALMTVEPVNWSDSSLGCPEPGAAYLTVITPGFQITLSVDDREYDYHTDASRRIVLCGADGKPVP